MFFCATPSLPPLVREAYATLASGREIPMRYALPLILLLAAPAAAQESKDLTYVCVEEHAAGLRYDAAARRWESTRFAPARQFTLTLKHAGALHRLTDTGRRE